VPKSHLNIIDGALDVKTDLFGGTRAHTHTHTVGEEFDIHSQTLQKHVLQKKVLNSSYDQEV